MKLSEKQKSSPLQAKALGKGISKSLKAPDFSLLAGNGPETGNPELPLPEGDTYSYTDFSDGDLNVKGGDDTSENGFDVTDIDQGSLGDCYFLAALGAVAASNPEILENLISGPKDDGSYDVTLYIDGGLFRGRNATVINVFPSFPTNGSGDPVYASLPGGTGEGKEIWPLLFEKAWAKHNGGYDEIEGGRVNEALEMITNKDTKVQNTRGMSESEILTTLNDALTSGSPVAADSHNFEKADKKKQEAAETDNVVGAHTYIVTAVDVKGDSISLRNPWGHSHLTLNAADFKRYFHDINYTK